MTSQFKVMIPELIAYQLVIVQHSKRFEYPSWLHYDIQWGAATKFTQWSQIHPQFDAFAFTAQGRDSSRCQVDGGILTFDCPMYSAGALGLRQTFHTQSNLQSSARSASHTRPLIPPPAKRGAKPTASYLISTGVLALTATSASLPTSVLTVLSLTRYHHALPAKT